MNDDQEPIVDALETASEAVDDKEVPQEIVTEPVDQANEDEVAAEAEEDDDLDFGFKKYRVPKSLKEAVEGMRTSFTQKTQDFSARTKELEAKASQQSEANEQELDARAQLRHVNAEIERFKNFDFAAYQAMRQTDIVGADEAWNYAQYVKNQKAELEGTLGKLQTTRTQAAQQEYAKRAEETRQFAQTKIKGWTPEIDAKLQQFAAEKGMTPEFIQRNMSPTTYELIHLAWIGQQSLQKQSAPPKAATPAASVKPLETVSTRTGAAPRVSLAELAAKGDMEGYAAARKAGRVR